MATIEAINASPLEAGFSDVATFAVVRPKWVVQNALVPGLNIIGAPPKEGKSTFAQALALVVAGYDVPSLPKSLRDCQEPGPVMLFSYEDQGGQVKHCMEEGLLGSQLLRAPTNIYVADDPWLWRMDEDTAHERFLAWVRKLQPRLVVIDPLRDFHALDENDSGQMVQVLKPLRNWAAESGAALVVVHHSKKPQGAPSGDSRTANDLRGSSAIFGAADGLLLLNNDDKDDSVYTMQATFKRHPSFSMRFKFGTWGSGQGEELLGNFDKKVKELLKSGADGAEIAKQLGQRPGVIRAAIRNLRRQSLIK